MRNLGRGYPWACPAWTYPALQHPAIVDAFDSMTSDPTEKP
ncbi:MAG: hypothetical protein U5L00_02685 [Desulfovermiculus sp.]|nr:hypothetical protein [Desulfovermiculus sp.]